jgi:CRP-like cAMP-binding protein
LEQGVAELSKICNDADYVVRQGEAGDCMYIVLSGELEVVRRSQGREFFLATLGPGDFFGEMSLIDNEPRTASVRSVGQSEVMMLDRQNFLGQVQQDASLAFQILSKMAGRARDLSQRLMNLGALLPTEADTVRTYGSAYPLPMDRDSFLAKVQAEPKLALAMMQEMSSHVREMDDRLVNIAAFAPSQV